MRKFKFLKNRSGFTMIEVAITMAIIGILAAAAIVSMSSTRLAAKVEIAQREVSSEIALAKAYSLQGKMQNNKVPCGYGVHFSNNNTYSIFYNHSNGEACDAFNDHSGTAYFSFSGFSTNLETRKLANNVTASYSDIYFTVPDGNIYVSGSALAAGSIDFILTLGSVSKKVSVNPQGLITSEE